MRRKILHEMRLGVDTPAMVTLKTAAFPQSLVRRTKANANSTEYSNLLIQLVRKNGRNFRSEKIGRNIRSEKMDVIFGRN